MPPGALCNTNTTSFGLVKTARSFCTKTDDEILEIHNPADLPDPVKIDHIKEPWIKATIIVPDEYLGPILELCNDRRGQQENLTYVNSRSMLSYKLPLSPVLFLMLSLEKQPNSSGSSSTYQIIEPEEYDSGSSGGDDEDDF